MVLLCGYDLRIVFDIVEHEGTEAILLLSVGTQDEVYGPRQLACGQTTRFNIRL